MNSHLVVIGAPGSGKGTQAGKLVSERLYNHISTGDLLRAEIKKQTDLGLKVSKIIESGQLVSDDIVMELLLQNCDLKNKAYIFDGFPRNVEQASMLSKQLLKNSPYVAVYFKIDQDLLISRIVNRRSCPNCGEIYNLISKLPSAPDRCDKCGHLGLTHRKDDHKDIVENRLEIFTKNIQPMLDYYQAIGKLSIIDASESEEKTFTSLLKII